MSKFVRSPPPEFENGDFVLIAGGEVDEYHISLRFFGEALDPDEITRQLGQQPTSTCRKGDVTVGKNTKAERIEPRGKWLLKAPIQPGANFEDQITTLLATLTPDLAVWRSLTSNFDTDLFCGVWLRRWNRGMDLSPRLMEALSLRGLALSLDIYVDYDG